MADPVLLSTLPWPLREDQPLRRHLLGRWSEPHRRYHTVQHLAECLSAGTELGAGPDELLALWLHDAVHTNTPGSDEAASAALARQLLGGSLEPGRVAEVARLVLLTASHRPDDGDLAGAVVCDADLWVLGADAERYAQSVAQLRDEAGEMAGWARLRSAQLRTRLSRPIFSTEPGRAREGQARANLHRELAQLAARPDRA